MRTRMTTEEKEATIKTLVETRSLSGPLWEKLRFEFDHQSIRAEMASYVDEIKSLKAELRKPHTEASHNQQSMLHSNRQGITHLLRLRAHIRGRAHQTRVWDPQKEASVVVDLAWQEQQLLRFFKAWTHYVRMPPKAPKLLQKAS